MNILLLTDGITPFVTGGMQRHSYNLADYLTRAGHRVHLVHCVPQGQPLRTITETLGDREGLTEDCLYFPAPGKFPGHYIRESYKYSVLVFNAVKDRLQHFDFVYAKGFTTWDLLRRRDEGINTPPIGVNFHGYEMFQPASGIRSRMEQRLLRKPVRENFQRADVLFSYGGKVTDVMISAGCDARKIIEIPSGIAGDWLATEVSPVGNVVKFLFTGRNERRKGLTEYHSAIQKFQGKAEFGFIGPIPEEQRLKRKDCIYYGAISDVNELRRIYREHHILVLPSHSEGMPNVILEAMASGVAVIATDVGAVSLMVNENTGWIMPPPPQPDTILGLLTDVMKDSKLIDEKRKAALMHVQHHFIWDVIVEKLMAEVNRRLSGV
jgi:glycosyltransferase involved in cell wall biosynthesis